MSNNSENPLEKARKLIGVDDESMKKAYAGLAFIAVVVVVLLFSLGCLVISLIHNGG